MVTIHFIGTFGQIISLLEYIKSNNLIVCSRFSALDSSPVRSVVVSIHEPLIKLCINNNRVDIYNKALSLGLKNTTDYKINLKNDCLSISTNNVGIEKTIDFVIEKIKS